MNENIRTVIPSDEAVPLRVIEPLDSALHLVPHKMERRSFKATPKKFADATLAVIQLFLKLRSRIIFRLLANCQYVLNIAALNCSSSGIVCIVGRSWTSAADADFWNTKVRVPMCVNAAAARSYLLHFSKLTDMGLAGRTPAQMNEAISAAVARKELPPMEPGAMCYMMSKEGYGGDSSPHWPSHLMFFFTDADLASWGANLPSSPVVGVNDPVEHLTQFVLTVPQWSDGTQAGEAAGDRH
jgi:hypothetical protein